MITVAALAAGPGAIATPEQKRQAEAYFQGALPFLAVKGPALDAFFKARAPELAAPAEVEGFLREHGHAMQRAAVRYAVEKMPTPLRAGIMVATSAMW